MFFIFLILLSFIPVCVGITILVLFKKNKLSKIIFLFLLLASFWHIDVSFLYAYRLFTEETIMFFFKLFRFGSIMVTPTIFYIGYTIVQEILPKEYQKKWRYLVNRTTVFISYAFALLGYIIGWSSKGISKLELIKMETSIFYFPVDGELSWIFNFNVLLFIVCIIISLLISLDVQNKSERSFLLYFNIFTAIGFTIGYLNMFPSSRLYPSSIAVLVFAISILILSSRMHLEIVNNMNKRLYEQKQFLFRVIDLNPNYIYAQDENGRYTLMNKSYAQLMGMSFQDMIGKTDTDLLIDLSDEEDSLDQEKGMFKLPEKHFIKEEAITAASGEVVWVQTVKVPIHLHESSTLLAVSTDITERKQYEDEIKFQANHDALTGLPNRRMFNDDLIALLEKAKAEGSQNAILFFDLDRFKYINDTLGHDVGDLLLVEVSRRIEMLLEEKHNRANIYRLGGDEFTILLPYYDATESEAFAKDLLAQFITGFWIDGSEYFITPSIGISTFPNDGYDANTLIKHADTAMYYVKERGKNNYQLFTSEMQQHFYRKMMIEKQLRTALDNEEFELYYQPIMDVKSNEIIGMESLIRWNNAVLGQVTPDEFISIMEETGMIIPIGKWVLNTAIAQTAHWHRESNKRLKISINVSVKQLLESTFVDSVQHAIENAELDATYVVLEITESIAMYAESMIEKLCALKKLGISLSMDDFGTGYSSLSYLNKYPLDSLKIDKSFVIGMNQDDENKALVKTIIAIAKQLDLKVIAEGVEGKEEYHFLAEIGCDYAQGYLFSRPLPVAEFKGKWLIDTDVSHK
ncbi:putative bifunctional diguanylate cyclase/phosphodiesterase [Lysinibacillus sp. NPDC097162]|uniref:putative bifunctional diguanylate cyclase/phosphodiesterase n=1 Tax=Lysinibacillus sp. NPDC097162 TaxID=3364140 RepID=UPI003816FC2B